VRPIGQPPAFHPILGLVLVVAGSAVLLGLGVVTHIVRVHMLVQRFADANGGPALLEHLRLSLPIAIGVLLVGASISWAGHRVAATIVPLALYTLPGVDVLWSAEVLRPGIVTGSGVDLGFLGIGLAVVEGAVLIAPAVVIGAFRPPATQPLDVFSALAAGLGLVPVALAVWYVALYAAYDGRVAPLAATLTLGAFTVGLVAGGTPLGPGLAMTIADAFIVRSSGLMDPYPEVALVALIIGLVASRAASAFRQAWVLPRDDRTPVAA
jgi:hypothetical protein